MYQSINVFNGKFRSDCQAIGEENETVLRIIILLVGRSSVPIISVNELDYAKATPMLLRIPAKLLREYVKKVGESLQRPIWEVVTKISLAGGSLTLQSDGPITDKTQLEKIIGLRDKVDAQLPRRSKRVAAQRRIERPTGLRNTQGVPHRGWTIIDMRDVREDGEDNRICEWCGLQSR